MCSSHIFTCPRVTSYNLFQTAFLPGLTLPQKTSELGSPTDLLPCKNDFLAEMKESLAGEDGRETEPKLRSQQQSRQSCKRTPNSFVWSLSWCCLIPLFYFPFKTGHHRHFLLPFSCTTILLQQNLNAVFCQSLWDSCRAQQTTETAHIGGFWGKIFLGAGTHKPNKNMVLGNPCYV